MVTKTPRVVKPRVAPVATAPNGKQIVDFRRDDMSDDEVLGTEALAPAEAIEADDPKPEPGNFVEIRGQRYTMPTLGPLALVIIPRALQKVWDAQTKRERLLAAGDAEAEAAQKSGIWEHTSAFLELITDLLIQAGVPTPVLMQLDQTEVQELATQFRPFA